ncbi:DUF1351 domain-containing protein [Pectinatus frisingensis]|uniref:DUF1351 domain-containing protein n=1 Tax=Pectinatus frisingensis TaxID=865 RepID=UPI0018C6CDE4|nr:DUF1351 domain-containing protein [Pectinatus frisingensis]
MNKLTIELAQITANNITWGYAQKKDALQSYLNQFKGLIITDDNLTDMAKSERELASWRIKLDKFRQATKTQYNKPLANFENEVKELIKLITDTEEPLQSQLDKFERQRKEKITADINQKAKGYADSKGLRQEFFFEFCISSNWLNKSITKSALNKEIISTVDALFEKQKLHDEREQMLAMRKQQIEMYCENYSERYSLNTPLTLNDVAFKTEGAELSELKDIIETEAKKRAEIEYKMSETMKPVEAPSTPCPKQIYIKKDDVLFDSSITCVKISQEQLNEILAVLENMSIKFKHNETISK